MKEQILNERQSAPTGAQTSKLEQEANHPLGVASCSESLVIDMDRMIYSVDVGTMSPTKAEKSLRDLENKYWN